MWPVGRESGNAHMGGQETGIIIFVGLVLGVVGIAALLVAIVNGQRAWKRLQRRKADDRRRSRHQSKVD